MQEAAYCHNFLVLLTVIAQCELTLNHKNLNSLPVFKKAMVI